MTYINSIGIDAFELRHATINSINFDLFLKCGGMYKETNDTDELKVIDSTTGEIKYLKELSINIKSCAYKQHCMTLEYVKSRGKGEKVLSIKANAAKFLNETNERNADGYMLSKLTGYVGGHLSKSGVYINLDTAKVHSFEINYNIHNQNFYQALRLLNEIWIKNGSKVLTVDSVNGIEFLCKKSSTRELKAYNKSIELIENGHYCEFKDNTRVEIKVSHISTIETLIGKERSFRSFCLSYKQIVAFYKNTIKREIQKNYASYTAEKTLEIATMLTQGFALKDICVKKGMNNEILDIDMLENAIKLHYKQSNKSGSNNVINNMKSYFKNLDELKFNELTGNMRSIETFFKEIGIQ